MGSVEIPEPVEGWNPVPGDAAAMVWWDGSAFSREAVRIDDHWEIVGDVAPHDDGTSADGPPGREEWTRPHWKGEGCLIAAFVVPWIVVMVIVALIYWWLSQLPPHYFD